MSWPALIFVTLLVLVFCLPKLTSGDRRGNGQPDLEPKPKNIDPHIYPLVTALNATGLCYTRASCEGHWLSLFYISQPYVAFCGDLQFAEQLDAKIHAVTNLPWYLEAHFGFDRKLCYRLAINMEVLGVFQTILLLARKDFDRDIQSIVKLVQAIANEIKY